MTDALRDRLLAEAYFESETFSGLDLDGVDLGRKELQSCTFRNARLRETRWAGSILEDCTFELCDLTGALPKGLALRDVRFTDSKLLGVDFRDLSPAPRLAFDACDLRYAVFAGAHLRKTRFRRSQLAEASFVDVDLTECDFGDSDLAGATFQGCVLHRADFSGARGVLLDPAKNRVKDARVSIESAILLATSFGMRVDGVDDRPAPTRRRR